MLKCVIVPVDVEVFWPNSIADTGTAEAPAVVPEVIAQPAVDRVTDTRL